MSKIITPNQLLGEIGEAAVRLRFLNMGFQFDGRSRLEAGLDGIAEVMDNGKPLARMIAVQVKATDSSRYASEDAKSFTYLLRPDDLAYWRGSNLPIILILYRRSDDSFYWRQVAIDREERKLQFDKQKDVLDSNAKDRLAALTVPKTGFGYYVPPLGGGEEALVNMLPVTLPDEIFVASTPYMAKQATAILLDADEPARFDWVIKGGTFWSFSDPRTNACKHIVDLGAVEAIDRAVLAFHEDQDEQHNFSYLLRMALDHQVRGDLRWSKDRKLFYFRASAENTSRTFFYDASKKKASTEVVNVAMNKAEPGRVDFVRHHAFIPRFEQLFDQWYLVINPTYFFTTNGFIPHSYPAALLAGKKRMDNSASLRGQVVMWHRFLTQHERDARNLFAQASTVPRLTFGEPPSVTLATRVPEDVWGSPKKPSTEPNDAQAPVRMKFETKIFDEPHLEFGEKYHHPDPRLGLFEAGPLQTPLGDVVKVAVVGSSKTVEDTKKFFTQVAAGFAGKGEKHPNMHPDFPGLGNRNPFRCKFEIPDGATAAITQVKIDKIRKEPHHGKAVEMAVGEIVQELRTLDESSNRPHVAIVALPVSLIERVWNAKVDAKATTEKDDSGGSDAPDFRGMLKAKAMDLSFPIQIVWEDVFDESASIPRKIKESRARKIQDLADRSWNLLTTLYYKGTGRIPWRKMPQDGEFTACYIGISFYREVGGQQLFTSAAQMFDERGRGFILKGKRAQTESRGRHPYMTQDDAHQLIADALAAYKNHHKHYPARVIVLKTSRFRAEEADGIFEALDEAGAEMRDLVWVQESYSVKVFRDGNYPVMRGTFVELDGKGLLYTNGSIPYYGTYPGMYDPKPLLLCPYPGSDSTIAQIANEVLSLTKINWNSTQMNQKLPIPIRAARAVGEVLKYVTDQKVSTDYARYI